MTWPAELHKDDIEQSAIISAFIQFMSMYMKEHKCFEDWKKFVLPHVKEYSLNKLKIDELMASKNVKIVEKRREPSIKFTSLEQAFQFIAENNNVASKKD